MQRLLEAIYSSKKYREIISKIDIERESKVIYPEKDKVLYSLESMDSDVKVVIIGQDPYYNPGQANGLSFSVSKDCVKLPPSLKNIFKELKSDIENVEISGHGDLSCWSKQGVLLLNSFLTVEKNKPSSHSKLGWDLITDDIVSYLNNNYSNLVFILWGNYAQNKGKNIDRCKHFVIETPHPSPFSARKGFFGSKPFSKTNEYLYENNKSIINWDVV